jgi:arabinofuranan 3-O-arabinosyltransferase
VTLGPGSHDLVTSGALEADTIRLTTPSSVPAAEPPAAGPAILSRPGPGGGFEIHVSGATGPYYLVVGQNWDPHWKASIDGRDLGPPTVVDGYSAGWRIDRLGSYEVAVRYGKQSLYTFALGLTAASLMVVVVIVIAHAWRRRRSGAPDPAVGQTRGR